MQIKQELPFGLTSGSLDREGATDDGGADKSYFLEQFRQTISLQGYPENLRWVALEDTAFSQMNQILQLKFSSLPSSLSPAHSDVSEKGRSIDY